MEKRFSFDFQQFEKHVLARKFRKDGRYPFRYGPQSMEYAVERADFWYPDELKNHAFYMDQNLNPGETYSILNVGVGSGLETKMPLEYVRDVASRRPVHYRATNVNTPDEYRDPPEEFLRGEGWQIGYEYEDGFILEEREDGGKHHVFLASRVVEWSPKPDEWFQAAYDALEPDGIAIVHTPPRVGMMEPYFDPIELADAAGFKSRFISRTRSLDPYVEILQMLLHKKPADGGGYPEYIRSLNRERNSFYYVTENPV